MSLADKENLDFEHFAHETLKAFSLTRNYNRWVCSSFEDHIAGKTILEVGCGIGNLTCRFREICGRVIGIDTSDLFIRHLRVDFPEMELYNFDISDEKVRTLAEKGIDAVVAINVLEHVSDDELALRNIREILRPEGRLILYVPALSWLYGSIDESLAHYRRYDKAELARKLERSGFEVEKMSCSNVLGIFGWFVNGKILRRKVFPIMQTIVFDKLVPALAKLERIARPPIGMNLTVIARKKSAPAG